MDSGENFEKNRFLNFAFYIENLSLYTQSLVRQNSHILKKLMEDFQIAELFDAISDKFVEHPSLKFLVCCIALSCVVPVIMFVAFGITSVIITFAGFLFIEGTLLAVGGLCMFICIIAMILLLSMLGMMFGVFYMLASKLLGVLKKFETDSSMFRNMALSVTQEPRT